MCAAMQCMTIRLISFDWWCCAIWTDDVSDKDQETWVIMKTLRGHLEDVYDLAWSMDSSSIISGSVDNTAIVWDVKKGRSQAMLKEHKSFVQGVAWDPRNKYMATLSSDR